MKKIIAPFFILFIVFLFFWQVFLKGFLPIPSDTIVGLYYPFRDIYSKTNPNGVPFKNFLITDPVRQQYPWKNLTVSSLKKGELPLWNPYNAAGTPLSANFQSAVFYPLNILFFTMPFQIAWTLNVILQPLLAGLFLYFYLRNLNLDKLSSVFGSISFSFSGFFIAWMEWGTVLHSALWLPLILLSIDKIFNHFIDNQKSKISFDPELKTEGHIKNKKLLIWSFIFVFSLTSSFFAGHLQTFFYLFIFSIVYLTARLFQYGKDRRVLFLFAICCLLFAILTLVQWYPTLQFIILSARDIDQISWLTPGWFIPIQNLIQFVAPDFLGNPTTLNYWGIWNYAEFVGYIGIVPLIISFYALFFRKDKKTLFFGTAFFLSLIFVLPNIFSQIPFQLKIPLIYTSQPTRLLFIADFSLSILAALGFNHLAKEKNKKAMLYVLAIFLLVFASLWFFVLNFGRETLSLENLKVARQNLILPSAIFILTALVLLVLVLHSSGNKLKTRISKFILFTLVVITVFDLLRFGWKFTPFTKKDYLFPSTPLISFLKNQKEPFRVISVDSRIFPPNFSGVFGIQSLDVYDPLYLKRYGELIAASERGKPDINPPFGFNRIINPKNYESSLISLLNVKYILSLSEINSPNLKKVFTDGNTIVYENSSVIPRAFFVKNVLSATSKQEAIDFLFNIEYKLNETAVVEEENNRFKIAFNVGQVDFVKYGENRVLIKTRNTDEGFLVLTDSFYPTWKARIDGEETKIHLTDYNFRGILVPEGQHVVEFYNTLF